MMKFGEPNECSASSVKDGICPSTAQRATIRKRLAILRKTLERGVDAEALEAFYSLLAAFETADECMHLVPAKDDDTYSQDSTITNCSSQERKESLVPHCCRAIVSPIVAQWLDSSGPPAVMVDAATQVQEDFDEIDFFTEINIENDVELENDALPCQENFPSPCAQTPTSRSSISGRRQRSDSPPHDKEVPWRSTQSCAQSGGMQRQAMAGAWTQSSGTLVLTAESGGTVSGTERKVTFNLTNTAVGQGSPRGKDRIFTCSPSNFFWKEAVSRDSKIPLLGPLGILLASDATLSLENPDDQSIQVKLCRSTAPQANEHTAAELSAGFVSPTRAFYNTMITRPPRPLPFPPSHLSHALPSVPPSIPRVLFAPSPRTSAASICTPEDDNEASSSSIFDNK